jgi:triacylglycerol lipase
MVVTSVPSPRWCSSSALGGERSVTRRVFLCGDSRFAIGAGLTTCRRQARAGEVFCFFCNRGLWNDWLERLTAMDVPFVAVTMEPPFGGIDRYANMIELAVQRLSACTGQGPVVVAHSMGGLAVRQWWADQLDASRIHRLITLGTPHHGTWLARWAFSVNGRQMRVNSPWLQALAQREPPGRSARCTCFFSHCDNIVFPPSTATLAGANNQHLQGVAHVHMVDHARPWEETLRHVVNHAATSPHLAR